MPLLDEILHDTPAGTEEWLERIAILRSAAPRPDLPTSFTELDRQLQALADSGLIAEREGAWWPTYKVPVAPKVNQQRELFA